MMVKERSRAREFLWALLALGAGIVATYLGYRAQARLATRLHEQALAQGLLVTVGKSDPGWFSAAFRDVTLRFPNAPGVTVSLNQVSLQGALFGTPRVVIDEVRFLLEGEPTTVYQSLRAIPEWRGSPVSWQRLSAEYSQRVLGKAAFEELGLERSGTAFQLRAAQAKLGTLPFRNVVLSLDQRNQLIEVGLGEPVGKVTPAQLGYFGSNHGAAEWIFSARHQPARPLAQQLGWELDSAFDASRVVVSSSLIVPDDPKRAKRGKLELALDHWPKPAWPDASALLGDTAGFVATFELPEQGSHWDLQRVTVALPLFTLTGVGRVVWGPKPSLSFEASGKLNCAQLRGNLPASVYLDQLKKYLEPDAAPVAAARLHEEVELTLRLSADRALDGKREAAWHLGAGCGLSERR